MVHEINPINLGLAGEQRAEMSSSLRSLDDRLLFICGLRFADYLKRLSISVLISISLFLFLLPLSLPPSPLDSGSLPATVFVYNAKGKCQSR